GIDVRNVEKPSARGVQWASGGTEWVVGAGAVDQFTGDDPSGSTIDLWKPPLIRGASATEQCAAFVTGGGNHVWVSEGRRLAMLDGASGSVLKTTTLAAAPDSNGTTCYGVAYEGGRLFAVRDPDESLGYLDPETGRDDVILAGFSGLTAGVGIY